MTSPNSPGLSSKQLSIPEIPSRPFGDRYLVQRILGRGGFGVTFLTEDLNSESRSLCVVKQLCPQVKDADILKTAQQRFEREAKMLSKLGNHPQIPKLLDYFVIEGEFYLVQEYVPGSTLSRLIKRYGPLSELWVKNFLISMLMILQYVHGNNVIHRDIKPSNIIQSDVNKHLYLIDFGAVKEQISSIPGMESSMLQTTGFVGTVGFAPSEQVALRPVYASDIYALGLTAVYLLTAKTPFDIPKDFKSGDFVWNDLATVSGKMVKVINKMIRPTLSQRYVTADEVLADMRQEALFDDLGQCMTNRPKSQENDSTSQSTGSNQAVKTAIALREWKSKLQRRESDLNGN